jgi:dTDP-4-dehydrorhamnose 3,5-epimerase
MDLIQSEIEGVKLTQLKQIADSRGSVLHMLRSDSPDFVNFGECYFSEVLCGASKAWKKHKIQTQNIAVPIGKILIVIYDCREKSKTKGKLQILELGRPDAYQRVTIPPQVWYGFKCISSCPALLVNCADHPHSPLESETLDLSDPSIPYFWV